MRAFLQWCNIIVSLQCNTICSCVESYVAIIHILTATVRNSLSEIKGKRSRIVPCYSSHEVIDNCFSVPRYLLFLMLFGDTVKCLKADLCNAQP